MFKTGIYKIVNLLNGKVYIGSGLDIFRRWREHKNHLKAQKHHNVRLQRAWNKYGEDAFEFIVIEYCLKEFLNMREQYWIDSVNACNNKTGYNIAPIAGSNRGIKYSEATRLKMSLAANNRSEQHKSKIGFCNKGRKHSEETKLKMRLAKLGKKKSPETIARMKAAKQNMSAETIAKMTKANRERAQRNKILFG